MFIECPKCNRRYAAERSVDTYEIKCECGEALAIFPMLSYRQNVVDPGEAECSVCKRTYNVNRYRNNTEIACICGNLLSIELPEIHDQSRGRRKTDHVPMQLQTKLHGLIDTCRLIHFVRNIEELLLLIVRVTTEMLSAEGCSVILRDLETHELVFNSVTGMKSSKLTKFRLGEGEGIVGHVIQSRKPLIVNEVEKDSRFSKRADKESGFSTRNILCIPLVVDNDCIGALEIVNKRNDEDFSEEDLFLGGAVSNQIAVAIHNVQLTEAALKAERLAAIGQAITGVAHCVKNMLNGLQGGFFVLESDIEDEFGDLPKRGFKMLGHNINRLQDLVQDMLSYSKDREPEFESVNINELVYSVVELMKAKAGEKNIDIKFEPDDTLPAIEVDQKGIYRCVLNLVSNAIDAIEEEGAGVSIQTGTDDIGSLFIEVEDQGCGMDVFALKSIFQPFYSSKGSRGTGLGLSVTQKIVQEHGGRIEVNSELEKGSKFSIYLPVPEHDKSRH